MKPSKELLDAFDKAYEEGEKLRLIKADTYKFLKSDKWDDGVFGKHDYRFKQMREEQKRLNDELSSSDNRSLQLFDVARREFEEWFKSNIEFGFGMGWMKPIAKKLCWYGYFAGYKKGADNE